MIEELFPLSQVITPNQAEAELLLKARSLPCKITSLADMLVAAQNLLTLGSEAVLLKGGHVIVSEDDICNLRPPDGVKLDEKRAFLLGENMEILRHDRTSVRDLVVDVLCRRGVNTITLYPRPRLQTKSTHGTGCTLSAALACALAHGNGITSEWFCQHCLGDFHSYILQWKKQLRKRLRSRISALRPPRPLGKDMAL